MYKYSILFVSAIFCCAQCLPLNATHSESSSSSQLHLFVNNSTESTNYHLTPVMNELENLDREIDDQLKAILPYLNFFFDSLLGTKSADDDNDCIKDMVIELIPDETAMPPTSNENADKKEDESNDKPVSKPDVVSTPETPETPDNIQSNS